jgi:hypothetical protein
VATLVRPRTTRAGGTATAVAVAASMSLRLSRMVGDRVRLAWRSPAAGDADQLHQVDVGYQRRTHVSAAPPAWMTEGRRERPSSRRSSRCTDQQHGTMSSDGQRRGVESGWNDSRGVLLTLASGQFPMTLDSSVMNVAIATVAADVGTTVTGIQAAITLYMLVMAMLMVAGGKIGSMIGRRRAFAIGCIIYGLGSLTTALAPNLPVLVIGWSVLEGIGAALILPAIVALVAGNFPPEGRPRAYGLVMGLERSRWPQAH